MRIVQFVQKNKVDEIRSFKYYKKYNQRKVVNDVSFEINKGEIIGLLGPNGEGTTSLYFSWIS